MSTLNFHLQRKLMRQPQRHRLPGRQRGVALITVLMVFAIATLVASKIMLTQAMDVQRVTGLVNRTQAHYYAVAAEQLALRLLQEDAQADFDEGYPSGRDNKGENWAQGPVQLDIDAIGTVLVTIVDLNRYYNVNNIINGAGVTDTFELWRFQSMLDALSLPRELATNLADYMDDDDIEEGFGTEGSYYAELSPPYVPANQALTDISELRLVKGFTPEVFNQLAPHITAVKLSRKLALNINTATPIALTSLQFQNTTGEDGPRGIGISRAQDIADLQEYEYFDGINAPTGQDGNFFSNHSTAAGIDLKERSITLSERNYSWGFIGSSYTSSSGGNSSGGSGGAGSATVTDVTARGEVFEINVRANYAGSIVYLTTIVVESVDGATGIASYEILERRETDNFRRFAENVGVSGET